MESTSADSCQCCHRFFEKSGKILAFLSAICMATSHFLTSLLTEHISPVQITAVADGSAAVLILAHNVARKRPFLPERGEYILVCAYSIGVVVDLLCTNFSLNFIPPFDSETIVSTNLVFTLIASSLFLKEPFDFILIIATVLSISGITFMVQPTFIFGTASQISAPSHRVIGSILALCASFSVSSNMCVNRKIQRTDPFTLVFAAFALTGVVTTVCGVCLGVFRVVTSYKAITYLICIIFSDFLKQVLLIYSLKLEKATTVAVIAIMNVPMVLFLQIMILGSYPNQLCYIGALLIFTGVIIVLGREPFLDHLQLEVSHVCLLRRREAESFSEYEEFS